MYNNKDYFLTDLEIVKVFEFERSFEFVDFFKDLYKKRQAEPENKKFYKSMLNGLIGSFQASPFYKNKYLKNFLPPNFKIPEEQKELDFCFEFKENNTFKYFPFSCAVISLARVYLMENIMKYYCDSLKRVIYVDTDSMIVENAWYNNIVDNKKIGCFKLEGVSDSFYLLKAKNYSSFNSRKKINLSLTKTAGFKSEELIPFFEKNVFTGQVIVYRTVFDSLTFLPKIISFKTYF